MKNLEILKAARTLVADAYCQGTLAEDVMGNSTHPSSPEACAFCLMGALGKAMIEAGKLDKPKILTCNSEDVLYTQIDESELGAVLVEIAESEYKADKLWKVNDDHGKAASLDVLDRAIKQLEGAK